MDTSKEYIKLSNKVWRSPMEDIEYILMCEKAKEIQKGTSNLYDDIGAIYSVYDATYKVCPKCKRTSHVGTFYCEQCGNKLRTKQTKTVRIGSNVPDDFIWLPRQDQLQEMIYNIRQETQGHWFDCFCDWVNTPSDFEGHFTSMEQLWLAFVMLKKYKKVWNGKEWKND